MSRTIEISEEKYNKIKDQLDDEEFNIIDLSDMIGKKFFFRTVTYHSTGRVVSVSGTVIKLENAAWIADSGRFSTAIKQGTLSEVEPVEEMFLNFSAVVDFFPWKHELPRDLK